MKVLMCPPTYFSVDYEINPWMSKKNNVNRKLAHKQWSELSNVYQGLGVTVETIDPVEGLPDMVFTANAGLVVGKKVVIANFRYPERKPEPPYFEDWFKHHGFAVLKLDQSEYFEGQGETLWFRDNLIAGYGFRANSAGHARLKEIIGDKLVSVKLIDPRFYHLDTGFLPIDQTNAAFYPGAFGKDFPVKLREIIPNLLEVSKEDALAFACNSVVVGKKVVMPAGAVGLPGRLRDLGYEIIELDISEFKKSGGGIRCLTLDLEP